MARRVGGSWLGGIYWVVRMMWCERRLLVGGCFGTLLCEHRGPGMAMGGVIDVVFVVLL